MYANTPEAAEHRQYVTLEALRRNIGSCREWIEDDVHDRCGKPAEYVLWGKLIPTDGLGPRCYDCAAKHIGHYGLESRSGHALINLSDLARDIDEAHFPQAARRGLSETHRPLEDQ